MNRDWTCNTNHEGDKTMNNLSRGQGTVLILAAMPLVAVGTAGAVATYVNMNNVLHRGASAMGLVAAGEGVVLVASIVALAVTLMGQHTPTVVRIGMWLAPLIAAGAGVALAPTRTEAVVMGITPLAMTAAGEGVAFVARRVVAYRTGVDIEQQRRSGLLLWHANRAANGTGWAKRRSEAAVWRLTKGFAATDGQLSVQLSGIQRHRISEGADANLAAVLGTTSVRPSLPPVAPVRSIAPATPVKAAEAPAKAVEGAEPTEDPDRAADTFEWLQDVLAEGEARVMADPDEKLMTVAEVASHLGVAPGTVRSWKHRGKLRVHDTVNGSPMFHKDDVDAFSV